MTRLTHFLYEIVNQQQHKSRNSNAYLSDGTLTFKGGNGANFPREIIKDNEESINHGLEAN